jgi:hypothetical protein
MMNKKRSSSFGIRDWCNLEEKMKRLAAHIDDVTINSIAVMQKGIGNS